MGAPSLDEFNSRWEEFDDVPTLDRDDKGLHVPGKNITIHAGREDFTVYGDDVPDGPQVFLHPPRTADFVRSIS